MVGRNIRQQELEQRINDMFHMACKWHKNDEASVEDLAEKSGSPIGIKAFLSKYGLKHSASPYACKRYYESLRDNDVFREVDPEGNYNPQRLKGFFVNIAYYAEWLKDPDVKIQDLV